MDSELCNDSTAVHGRQHRNRIRLLLFLSIVHSYRDGLGNLYIEMRQMCLYKGYIVHLIGVIRMGTKALIINKLVEYLHQTVSKVGEHRSVIQ